MPLGAQARILSGVAVVSAATLLLEITLTRLFSLVQWYHFAFMVVGIALLGFGTSGTLLAVMPVWRTAPGTAVVTAALGIPAIGAAYLALLLVPFDPYRIALEPVQYAYLGLQILALLLPFLCAGLTIGTALVRAPQQAGLTYGASLAGSGTGCLLAVAVLQILPAPSALLVAGALNAVSASVLSGHDHAGRRVGLLVVALILAVTAALVALPLRMSPYKALSQYLLFPDAHIVFTRWSPTARVDVVRSRAIHAAAGLSTMFDGSLPPQLAVTVDGDAPRTLPETTQGTFTEFLPSSVAYQLRRGRTLVVNGGAGLEVLAASHHQMPEIVVAEPDAPVIEAAVALAPALYATRGMSIMQEDGRVHVRRVGDAYDIIQIAPRESFQIIASGAFSLTEHYLYTTEAFADYYWRQMLPSCTGNAL